jgi:hypothetical protein
VPLIRPALGNDRDIHIFLQFVVLFHQHFFKAYILKYCFTLGENKILKITFIFVLGNVNVIELIPYLFT